MTEEKIRQDIGTVEQIVDGMNLFDDDLMALYRCRYKVI